MKRGIWLSGFIGLILGIILLFPYNIRAEENVSLNTGYEEPVIMPLDEGITEEDIWNQEAIEQYRASSNYDWEQYSSDYYYSQMSEDEKRLWDALDSMCKSYLTTQVNGVSVTSSTGRTQYLDCDSLGITTLTMSDIQNVELAFVYSNPQYYFLSNSFWPYTDYVALGIYPEFLNGSSRSGYTSQFQNQIDSWIDEVTSIASTNIEKEKEAHDLLCDKLTYGYTTYDQSCVSAFLFNQTTVCAGYTKAYTLLLNGLGIDAVSVTSDTHAWNEVYIDGQWYVVDTTWDDQISYICYNGFNDSYDGINSRFGEYTTHIVESFWTAWKPATSTVNYYAAIPTERVCQPTITVSTGSSTNKVSINCSLNGASIYYTTDGTTPTTSSTLYTGAFELNKSCTVKAIAVKSGYETSRVSSQSVTGVAVKLKWTNLNTSVVTQGDSIKFYYAVTRNAKVTIKAYNGDNSYLMTLVSNKSIGTNDQVLTWNLKNSSGAYVSAGTYRFTITVEDDDGNKVVAHKYFTVKSATPVSFKWTNLNSSSVSQVDGIRFYYAVSRKATISVKVYNGDNSYLMTLVNNKSVGTNDQVVTWNLKNSSGTTVNPGTYRFTITATDEFGNTVVAHKYFTVTKKTPVTYKWTNLNTSTVKKGNSISFYYAVSRSSTVTIKVYNGDNSYLMTLVSNKNVGTNDQVAVWNLKNSSGKYVAAGTYRFTITAIDSDGNKVVAHKYFKVQ